MSTWEGHYVGRAASIGLSGKLEEVREIEVPRWVQEAASTMNGGQEAGAT
jgi:hypothetical protein